LKVADKYEGKRTKCPRCGEVSVAPGPESAGAEAEAISERPTGRKSGARRKRQEGYDVAEEGPPCPNCRATLQPGAVLCVDCGYNLKTGKQLHTTVERFERTWEVGMPLYLRLPLFLLLQAGCVLLAVVSKDVLIGACVVVLSFVFFSLLLGTYVKLHVARSTKGKVLLTRTWCLLFVPALPHRVDLRRYDAVGINTTSGFGLFGWTMLIGITLVLLPLGIVPGLLWWYWAFTQTNYCLTLENTRSGESVPLYRSWSDVMMRDIVDTLKDVARLQIVRR
jgi:hypothetical protein